LSVLELVWSVLGRLHWLLDVMVAGFSE